MAKHILLVTFACLLACASTQGRKLPAWRPGDENDLCARFQYHYEARCFKPKKVKLNNEIEVAMKTGTDRLQMVCAGLANILKECLDYFNDKCSTRRLGEEINDFTSATLAVATKPALSNFKNDWEKQDDSQKNLGLSLKKCTVFGGNCQRYKTRMTYCTSHGPKTTESISKLILLCLVIPTYIVTMKNNVS